MTETRQLLLQAQQGTINKEVVNSLAALLSSKSHETNDLINTIGDLASDTSHRTTIGEQALIDVLIAHFCNSGSHEEELVRLIARALGNMCFDHAENRTKILQHSSFIPHLLQHLDVFSQKPLVIRNLCGALANLVSETESAQKVVIELGGLNILLHIISSMPDEARIMASRAVSNILDCPAALEEFRKNSGLQLFLATTKICPDIEHDFIEVVNKLLQESTTQEYVVQSGALSFMVSQFSRHIQEEEEDDTVEAILDTLISASEIDLLKSAFISQHIVDTLMQMEQIANLKVKSSIFKIIANVSLNDDTIVSLFGYFPKLFATCNSLVHAKLGNPECDVIMYCLMAIGNIVRNDTNCKALIKNEQLVPNLFNYAHHQDKRIAHLALGAVRNLSIPAENKEILVAAGVFDKCLVPVLKNPDQRNPHLQYAVVGTIRSLVAGSQALAVRLGDDGVLCVIALAQGELRSTEQEDNDQPPDKRVEYEAARILAKLTEYDIFKSHLQQEAAVKSILDLIKSKYEVLQVEGLKALLQLGKNVSTNHEVEAIIHSFSSENAEVLLLCEEIKNKML